MAFFVTSQKGYESVVRMNVASFLTYLEVEKRCADKTIKAYANDLSQFEDFIQTETGHFDFKAITKYEVRLWVMDLVQRNYSPQSVNRKLSSLRSCVKYFKRVGALAKDPMVGIVAPKSPKRLPVFMKPAEMDRLLDEIPFGSGFEGVRDRLILDLLYSTGLRVSELSSLTMQQMDLADSSMRIIGKRNKERLIPLNESLVTHIQTYLKERHEVIVSGVDHLLLTLKGAPVYDKLIYRVVFKSLGLVSTQAKRSPHVLRHSFATVLLNNGAELNVIKELLGHASLSATEVYTHSTFKDLSEAYKLAHPRA